MLTWTLVSSLWKQFTQPGIKVHLEICSNVCSVLLYFQSFTEKPVFRCPFAHPMILFLSYLVKTVFNASVKCKLANPDCVPWNTVLKIAGHEPSEIYVQLVFCRQFTWFYLYNQVQKSNVTSELINVTRAWDKEISESPTGIEPMTSWTPDKRSIHWATTTHGEQGHLIEFICTARIRTVKVIMHVICE